MIDEIKSFISIKAQKAKIASDCGLGSDAKLLEPFCKEFFKIVWDLDFALPSPVKCNQDTVEFGTKDKKMYFQITVNGQFRQKCEKTISQFKIGYPTDSLYIVFFRDLTSNEKKEKRNIEKSNPQVHV